MQFARSSGILLHPTSLPGAFGSGDLGAAAYQFIDWLSSAGQSLWQMLPMGPAGMANSPYMSLSAFAGSPLFIDLVELVTQGWLTNDDLVNPPISTPARVDYQNSSLFRMDLLRRAAIAFFKQGKSPEYVRYEMFC